MKRNLVTAAATAGLVLTAFGASASAQENTYTVHSGDSLWKISHLNNVSIDHIKDWNHLSSDRIYINQKLSLTYTVKAGDSLWALARSFGTTVRNLKSLNGLSSDLIRIGQQLKVPESKSSTPAAVLTTPTSYIIQKGDTLSEIGARFNLSVSQLKLVNHLTNDTIRVGQTLNVSGAGSSAAYKVSAVSTSTAEKSDAKAAVKPDSSAAKKFVKKVYSTTEKSAATTATTEKPAVTSDSTATKKSVAKSYSTLAEKPAAPSNSTTAQKPVVKAETVAPQKAVQNPASTVQEVIAEAEKYMGTPYRWGGSTPAGFDCSGFTKYVFNNVGLSLPRTTETQWEAGTPVHSPNVGDLVFFQTYKIGPSHVGIYLGNNKFISAASQGVVISDMTAAYWKSRYLGARSPY